MNHTNLRNNKGIMLIWFYLLITVVTISAASLFALSFQESRLMTIDQARNKAFYVAEAGVDQKLQELRAGNVNPIGATSFGGGTYSVSYDQTTQQIQSTGTVDQVSKILMAFVKKEMPPGVNGAITSVGPLTFNGNIEVDGRDHDASGNVTGSGTYGASSASTVTQSGNSTIGGNGFEPEKPENPAAIEQNASNTYTTPEEVLGVSAGSLDQYKTSNPPSTPMSGIVYFTGNEWQAPDFGEASTPSTGILIVHNSAGTALLKNLHGYFNGLIIADDVIHINGDAVITGGMVLQQSSGNSVGNGAAHINYSSTVLSNLPLNKFTVVSWQDKQNQA